MPIPHPPQDAQQETPTNLANAAKLAIENKDKTAALNSINKLVSRLDSKNEKQDNIRRRLESVKTKLLAETPNFNFSKTVLVLITTNSEFVSTLQSLSKPSDSKNKITGEKPVSIFTRADSLSKIKSTDTIFTKPPDTLVVKGDTVPQLNESQKESVKTAQEEAKQQEEAKKLLGWIISDFNYLVRNNGNADDSKAKECASNLQANIVKLRALVAGSTARPKILADFEYNCFGDKAGSPLQAFSAHQQEAGSHDPAYELSKLVNIIELKGAPEIMVMKKQTQEQKIQKPEMKEQSKMNKKEPHIIGELNNKEWAAWYLGDVVLRIRDDLQVIMSGGEKLRSGAVSSLQANISYFCGELSNQKRVKVSKHVQGLVNELPVFASLLSKGIPRSDTYKSYYVRETQENLAHLIEIVSAFREALGLPLEAPKELASKYDALVISLRDLLQQNIEKIVRGKAQLSDLQTLNSSLKSFIFRVEKSDYSYFAISSVGKEGFEDLKRFQNELEFLLAGGKIYPPGIRAFNSLDNLVLGKLYGKIMPADISAIIKNADFHVRAKLVSGNVETMASAMLHSREKLPEIRGKLTANFIKEIKSTAQSLEQNLSVVRRSTQGEDVVNYYGAKEDALLQIEKLLTSLNFLEVNSDGSIFNRAIWDACADLSLLASTYFGFKSSNDRETKWDNVERMLAWDKSKLIDALESLAEHAGTVEKPQAEGKGTQPARRWAYQVVSAKPKGSVVPLNSLEQKEPDAEKRKTVEQMSQQKMNETVENTTNKSVAKKEAIVETNKGDNKKSERKEVEQTKIIPPKNKEVKTVVKKKEPPESRQEQQFSLESAINKAVSDAEKSHDKEFAEMFRDVLGRYFKGKQPTADEFRKVAALVLKELEED